MVSQKSGTPLTSFSSASFLVFFILDFGLIFHIAGKIFIIFVVAWPLTFIIVWLIFTLGNCGAFLVKWLIQFMVFAFRFMNFFVEFGLNFCRFKLNFFQSF